MPFIHLTQWRSFWKSNILKEMKAVLWFLASHFLKLLLHNCACVLLLFERIFLIKKAADTSCGWVVYIHFGEIHIIWGLTIISILNLLQSLPPPFFLLRISTVTFSSGIEVPSSNPGLVLCVYFRKNTLRESLKSVSFPPSWGPECHSSLGWQPV